MTTPMTWSERQAANRAANQERETREMDDFVPPKGEDTWASFVPARDYPQFKLHKGQGQARGALGIGHWLGGVRGGLIFNLIDGTWTLVERVEPHTPADGLPWRRKSG